ncbi:ATP-binding protein [Clostridium sp.]|uniref:sensor histidine kinase n=1 Tax=Clostridium sp. TaxID=1506 RepID=UPI00283AED1B|nr:ATP-binding protein [Clostridium sp.]MDR3594498.1 ATP-binding protein [Clostridium sp.]
MNNDLPWYTQKSLIKEKGGTILDVNDKFCDLTQFSKTELCGKNIIDVLDKLFRCTNQIEITDEETQATLFTKTFDVRFVKIKKYTHADTIKNYSHSDKIENFAHFDNSTNLYIFDEIENSRLDNKLLFVENLINDNKIGIGIFTAADLKLIKANQKYLDYIPEPFNTKEVVYGKCLGEFMDKFKKCGGENAFTNIIKNNKPVYLSELAGNALGDNDYWDITITPISENGEVKYIMSMLENVTDRVLSRKHIQRKNRQLESIIESVEDIISIVDKDGKYVRQNKLVKELLGENSDRSVGFSSCLGKYYDLAGNPISLNDLCFIKLLSGKKVKGERLKYVYNDKEYYLNINAIPIFDENKQFETGVIVIHNITELVQNNKLISTQKKELEIIFNNMYDGLAVIDKNGNFIKKNKALNEEIIKNYNVSTFNTIEDIEAGCQKYYNDNDEELDLKELPAYMVLKGETVKQRRVVIKNTIGKVHLDFNAVPIFDEKGDFQYGIILSHDVTHIIDNNNKIKQQQQLIIEAEHEKLNAFEKTLAMKDEFISLISHEFKTPLNVIYSAIQLIEYIYINDIPDKVKDLIKNIKQNTFRQLRLVNNLLDITRLNSGRFKLNIRNIDIVSLTRQISQSVKLYSDQKNIKLLFKCSLSSKNIAADDEKLERIILNLLSNAIKFTDEGGTVTVSLDENIETNMIVINVSDTGMGIPIDKQELIFERFGQVDSNLSRRAEGTGIGLSLVKKFVDVLNGNIELESDLGKGSTFRIILPTTQCIDKDRNEVFLDGNNRLVNALHVEFSDIYL